MSRLISSLAAKIREAEHDQRIKLWSAASGCQTHAFMLSVKKLDELRLAP